MPDLAYGDLVQSARSANSSQTNALAVIPLISSYSGVTLNKPYCEIEDVKSYIKNSEYDDGFYSYAINQASRMVDKFMGRNFWYNDYTQKAYRPQDVFEDRIFFPFPIRRIDELKVGGNIIGSNSYFYVSIEDDQEARNFFLQMEFVSESDLSSFAQTELLNKDTRNTPKKIEVKGIFGYTITGINQMPTDAYFPADVRRATTMIAGTLTDQFRREVVDKDGNKENLLETMIPHDAIKLLKKSKRLTL